MKLNDLLKDIPVLAMMADPEQDICGISYDSRKTKPGDVFVAVLGYESDGHRFIPAAVKQGAAVILCQKAPEEEIPYVLVEDSRLALALLSRNYFGDPAAEMCIIGVTGTNGKTTSTLLLKHMLEQCLGAKVGLIGTTGNMIGDELLPSERTTPESYELQALFAQMRQAGCSHVVMEVSSHSLVLHRVAGIRFEVGVFSNLTQDHLDFHGTMEAYAQAKAKLFENCSKAVINYDDSWSRVMMDAATGTVLSYALDSDAADLLARDIRLQPASVKFCAVTLGEIARVNLGIPGRFSVYNALAVIGCCMQLGIPLEEAAESLGSAKGVRGRVESVPTDGDYTILIDYAHTPDALENVLRAVRETAQGRVVALFGCGGDRDRTKRPVMGAIGTELSDFAVITSDNPRTEEPQAIIDDILSGVKLSKKRYLAITDRVEAIEWVIEHHQKGDVIVLAGKGHETYQEIHHVKYHMDEREIVAQILEKRKNR